MIDPGEDDPVRAAGPEDGPAVLATAADATEPEAVFADWAAAGERTAEGRASDRITTGPRTELS